MTASDSRFPEGSFPARDPGWLATHAIHTWPQMLRRRAAQWGERPALRHKLRGLWHTWTWAMYWDQVRATASTLPAFKVAIRGARGAFLWRKFVGVHRQTH